jgi:formamidopyrimidine-DNA glycosylase
MPELPEVETVRSQLAGRLTGARIVGAVVSDGRLVSRSPAFDRGSLAGRRIVGVGRHGKLLLVDLDDGRRLVFHLKMTGGFSLDGAADHPHARLAIDLVDAGGAPFRLLFTDLRRFGRLYLVVPGGESPLDAQGPDALAIDEASWGRLLRSSGRRVKSLLLDQAKIAGIGNIYADEMLHRARVHPATPALRIDATRAGALYRAMRDILAEAIERGGSTVRDYASPCGPGSYQERHAVYGRAGETCLSCGTVIRRVTQAGRGTHYCPACQRPSRRRATGGRR